MRVLIVALLALLATAGRNIMEYYTLYFDYEGRAVYLKPNV